MISHFHYILKKKPNYYLPGLVAGCVERLVALEVVAEGVRRGVGVALVAVRAAVVAVAVRVEAEEADLTGVVALAALELLGAEGTRLAAATVPGGRFCVSVAVFLAAGTVVPVLGAEVVAGFAAEGAAGVAFLSGDNWVGRAGLVPFVKAVLFVSAGNRLLPKIERLQFDFSSRKQEREIPWG